MVITTWKKELENAFSRTGDDFNTMESTLSEAQLNKEFDSDYGGFGALDFTAWGKYYIYSNRSEHGASCVVYERRG